MHSPWHRRRLTPRRNQALWATMGALGVALLALGAALVYIQARPPEPLVAVLPPVATDVPPAPELAVTAP